MTLTSTQASYQTPNAETPECEPAGQPHTPRGASVLAAIGRWLLRGLLAVSALWLVVWFVEGDSFTPFTQLIAFTQYVAATSVVLLTITVTLRRWRAAIVAALIVLGFTAIMLPRMLVDPEAVKGDIPLRVLSVNLFYGKASPSEVLALVDRLEVDVLSLQEVTPRVLQALESHGLNEFLPYSVTREQAGSAGTALYARYPLDDGRTLNAETTFDQARATMTMATPSGDAQVDLLAAHPVPPFPGHLDQYASDYAHLPPAAAALHSRPIRVLAGDFNATLDSSQFRSLLATGYRDAAASRGQGLTWTWPTMSSQDSRRVPPVTIDHIVVDDRAGVRHYSVHTVSNTDHRGVFAELRLPYM